MILRPAGGVRVVRLPPEACTLAQRLVHGRDLLYELVLRDLRLRYKRSSLGFAWSLINPLAQLLVYYFVFGLLLPLNIPHYASFLLTAVLAWNWFQGALLSSTAALVDNRDLVRRPGFPIGVLPAVTVTSHFVHFLLAVPVLLWCVRQDGLPLTGALAALPLVIAVQFALTLGLAYLVAMAHVPFRDTQYLLGIALQMLFFLTPIFYDLTAIPERYRAILAFNPMTHVVTAYRSMLLDGTWPAPGPLLGIALVATIVLLLGLTAFRRAGPRLVEDL